jgi:hypothetical protein
MVMQVLGSQPLRKYLSLDVTNFGPGEIIVRCAIARPKKPWYKRRQRLGLLNPIDDLNRPDSPSGPFGGGLPKKLAVGETLSLHFPYQAKLFLSEPLDAIGINDSFRRSHWAPRRDFEKVLEKYRQDFPGNTFE